MKIVVVAQGAAGVEVHSLHPVAPEVLAAARIGGLNLHVEPLLGYAGINIRSSAIYHGERGHGVSLRWMAAKVDTGPTVHRASFPLWARDAGLWVYAAGLWLTGRLLDPPATDPATIRAREQDLSRSSALRRDGWTENQADQTVSHIQACDYAPGCGPRPTVRPGDQCRGGSFIGTDVPPGGVVDCGAKGIHVAAGAEWVLVQQQRVNGIPAPPDLLSAGHALTRSAESA